MSWSYEIKDTSIVLNSELVYRFNTAERAREVAARLPDPANPAYNLRDVRIYLSLCQELVSAPNFQDVMDLGVLDAPRCESDYFDVLDQLCGGLWHIYFHEILDPNSAVITYLDHHKIYQDFFLLAGLEFCDGANPDIKYVRSSFLDEE